MYTYVLQASKPNLEICPVSEEEPDDGDGDVAEEEDDREDRSKTTTAETEKSEEEQEEEDFLAARSESTVMEEEDEEDLFAPRVPAKRQPEKTESTSKIEDKMAVDVEEPETTVEPHDSDEDNEDDFYAHVAQTARGSQIAESSPEKRETRGCETEVREKGIVDEEEKANEEEPFSLDFSAANANSKLVSDELMMSSPATVPTERRRDSGDGRLTNLSTARSQGLSQETQNSVPSGLERCPTPSQQGNFNSHLPRGSVPSGARPPPADGFPAFTLPGAKQLKRKPEIPNFGLADSDSE